MNKERDKNEYSQEMAKQKAQQHDFVHHYTTFDSLEKIVNNRSLLLNRIDLLNDTVENDRILDLWKEKVYVSCFTYREYESYFFWKTYAKGSKDGVSISFNTKDLSGLSIFTDAKCKTTCLHGCKKSNLDVKFSPDVTDESWGIYDYSCVDVMYLHRGSEAEGFDNFLGRFKYKEWDVECETRLRVAIKPRCFEYTTQKARLVCLKPENQYIYAKLSEQMLSSMTITLSPFSDDSLREKVVRLLEKNGLYEMVQINDSVLKGEIKQDEE